MSFGELHLPFAEFLLRIVRGGNFIGNELHHLPLSFRLAHDAADRLEVVLVVFGNLSVPVDSRHTF